jgi:hypothetical protein
LSDNNIYEQIDEAVGAGTGHLNHCSVVADQPVAALVSFAMVIASLLAGCTSTLAGQPYRPANVVERALPTAAELGKALGFRVETSTAPQLGGLDVLRDDKDALSPRDCAGITHAGYRQSYQGAPVRDTGRRLWMSTRTSDEHASAAVSIVELDSANSAQSWYTKSIAQWHKCHGITVAERTNSKFSFIQKIGQVTDSGGTLTAQIAVTTSDTMISPGVNWRALTTTSRYLVDVEVFRIGNYSRSADPDPSALAHLVVDKIAGMR